jgi:NAD(P)-dependent dehydrogenase (short-subunit alcohol dehydrogenase family)
VKTFGATSTTDEVLEGVDLSGKRILVTGVSAGLGVETARALAAHGAYVVGTVRDLAKAEKATQVARDQAAKGGGVELVECDLASLESVRACADKLNQAGKPFDVAIGNAGVMATPFGKTEDGFETQFGTNHLGHFVLFNRIAPLVRERVVMLSSNGHRGGDVNLDDPNFDSTPYSEFGAYSRSKTANALFAVEFDRRHKARGVRAAAVHPGGVPTNLDRYMTPELHAAISESAKRAGQNVPKMMSSKTIPQGAATTVWAGFVAPASDVGGRYCEDCQVAEIQDDRAIRNGVRAYAADPENAKALWAKSEEMVGERFAEQSSAA